MADAKVTSLSALTSISVDDLFYVVDDPAGTPASKKATAATVANFLIAQGAIQGLEISFSSTTAIAVAAGTVNINGKQLTYAGGTLTSGSTMKDNNNSTVTIGASKCYYVYAFDNAGTLEIRVQDYAAATYGGAPTFDTTYDYWKGPSVGAQARRIGRFFTNGSSNIIKFYQVRRGRWSKTYMYDRQAITYVNGVAQASYTSITITPYITADVAAYDLSTQWITAAAAATGGISLSWDSGTTADGNRVYFSGATNHNAISASWETPNTGTLHYKTDNSSTAYISLAAVSEVV